jgi:uncharacterized protein
MAKIFTVRVDDIPDEGLQVTTAWDSSSLVEILEAQTEPFTVSSPLELDIFFSRSGSKIILEGSCTLQLQLSCARCLIEFAWPLAERFRYILWSRTKDASGKPREDAGEDLDVVYYEGDHIDLRPLVREQIYLNIPGFPHCTETCKGLCPKCGANLNETSCSCAAQTGSSAASPFSVLKKQKH